METKENKLVSIDIETSSTSFDSLLAECKGKGNVEIIDYGSKEFRADVTGQKGSISYTVKGEKETFVIGADTVAKLSLQGSIPVKYPQRERKLSLSRKTLPSYALQCVDRKPTKQRKLKQSFFVSLIFYLV